MNDHRGTSGGGGHHGASHLPVVEVEAYNSELKDADGFLGDRASNRAFRAILEELRVKVRAVALIPSGRSPAPR